jgi:hypothetical protein
MVAHDVEPNDCGKQAQFSKKGESLAKMLDVRKPEEMELESRRQHLEALFDSIKAGICITDEDFKAHLMRKEREQYNRELKQPRPLTPDLIRGYLTRYLEFVDAGDRCHNRAESLGSSHLTQRRNLHRRAESEYSHALECLEETLDSCPSARDWLDRSVEFSGENFNVNPDVESVPRLIDSRSQFNRARKFSKRAKIQLETLKAILYGLGMDVTYDIESY